VFGKNSRCRKPVGEFKRKKGCQEKQRFWGGGWWVAAKRETETVKGEKSSEKKGEKRIAETTALRGWKEKASYGDPQKHVKEEQQDGE